MAAFGLTDLERGKYLPGGSNVSSTVRVQNQLNSTIPLDNYQYSVSYLKTSGNAIDQNVNGSVTPVRFSFAPVSPCLVKQLTVTIVGLNMASILDYFSIAGGLTNGVQFISKVGLVEREIFNVKKAIEYSHATAQGITNNYIQGNTSEDIFITDMIFPFELPMDAGREIIIVVRDNLSSIRYQRASVSYREII